MADAAAKTQSIFSSYLKHNVTKTSSGAEIHSYTSDLGKDTSILTLIHGYPQSAYEWRYIVPELADKISLFVPELPGYGISSPCKEHSKKAVGSALLEALEHVYGITKGNPRKVILGGHDRGARICHRLAVDKDDFPNLNVLGTIMLDIVPTLVQWQAFANPAIATGYFHWPLLANADYATALLTAYGGGKWARDANNRITGSSDVGKNRVQAGGALEIYEELYDKKDTIYYSCLDYASGAAPEANEQVEDQKKGKKIEVPTLVMFSQAKLGANQDVANIWKDWIKSGVQYEGIGVGSGYGHYLPEEAHDEVLDAIVKLIDKMT